ncbi:MAG TPA: zf-HC2 domain-containing protein [Bacilli bacterium]|nr:zf-HC2 domain-containing protein [Bacilli bacterium]
MTCPQEMRIEAYLDNELSREERKELARHLETCSHCQRSLAEAKRLSEWVEEALGESIAEAERYEVDVNAAWSRMEATLATREQGREEEVALVTQLPTNAHANETMTTEQEMEGRWTKMMKRNWRWLAGTAAAAVMISTFTIPQVQAAASDLLSIFRVDKIEMVKLTEQDLRDLENWISTGSPGKQEIKGLGTAWIDEGRSDNYFETQQAAEQAGYHVPSAPNGYALDGISIHDGFTLNLKLDTEKSNKLLKQFGADVQFDPKLNQKQFSVTFPQDLHAGFNSADSTRRVDLDIVDAPQIHVPADVDLDQLRNTVLKLPFLPEQVAQQLANIEDWQTTMPVPYVANGRDSFEEVQVNGVEGLFVEAKQQPGHGMLMWQEEGKLYRLELNAHHEQNLDTQQLLLSFAKLYDR